ncbi:PAS domain S-box protein [Bacillus sp. PS06]|uniref:PAS domain S-box protein n=1 Tax=Bacillus sp. PS06 TaxID=2764176 RepID=UPI0017842B79|nr:PAS domain S-box protein [Bacillus sp. PS06]MBD8070572.1 PAS domain S-box protein [Bacillus sp. PS06]
MNTTQRIEGLNASFLALNAELELIYCNAETEKLIGQPMEKLIGRNIIELIPELQFSPHLTMLKKTIDEHKLLHFQEYIPQLNRWFEFRVYPGIGDSPIYLVDVTNEIMKNKVLACQRIILEMIAKGKPLHDVLHKIAEFIEEHSRNGYCSVLLLDQTGEYLQVKAAPSLPEEFTQQINNIQIGPYAEGCGKAAYLNRNVFIDDFETASLSATVQATLRKQGFQSALATPVIDSNGTVLGTFAFYYHDKRTPNELDNQLIELSSYLCSIAIEKDRIQQQKLIETETKFNLISENMTDLIKIIDRNYIIQYCSPSIKSVLGLRVEDLEGSQSMKIIYPEDLPNAIHVFNLAVETKTNQNIEYRTKNVKGEWIWFEAALTPLIKADGEVDQVLVVSRDISERKRSERLLKQSEQRYKSLFMHNPDGVYSLDLNGRFVKVNDQLIELTGYTRKELQQMVAPIFIKPEDQKRVYNHFHHAANGDAQNFEVTIVHKNGQRVYLNVKKMPIKIDGEIVGVYGIAKDITEQQHALKELENSEMKFRSVVESASEAIIITDHQTKIVSWNKRAEAIFGYSQEEAIGQGIEITVSKDFLNKHQGLLKDFIGNQYEAFIGKPIEITGVNKNGEEIPLEVSFNYWQTEDEIYISAIARDISNRKRVELALQKSEEKYRNLIENLPEAVLIFNEERLLYVNKRVVQLFGAETKEDLYHQSIFDRIDPEYHYVYEAIRSTIYNHYLVENMEVRLLTFSGETIDVQINVVPTTFEGEKAAQIILRDITELKRSKELLIHAEKLSAAGELAAGIAHEIRNPLTSIKGFIQLAHQSGSNQERYYPIILTEIDRINSIISELLLLAKPKKTEFKKLALESIVTDMLKLYSAQAILHDIELIQYIDAAETDIIGHEGQLKQVFINLFKNALEAMPGGGIVEVRLTEKKHSLILSIKDNGEGIPKKNIPNLGQPFFTTKEKGTGLGLATCFSIIENHKGLMEINSVEHDGTEITITLPRLKSNEHN